MLCFFAYLFKSELFTNTVIFQKHNMIVFAGVFVHGVWLVLKKHNVGMSFFPSDCLFFCCWGVSLVLVYV